MAEHSTAPAAAAAARRRGLGRGLTVFLIADVLLVLTFLVMLAVTNAGGGTGTPEPDPVASEAAPEISPEQSAPAEPDESEALEAFVLPSGNIFCAMTQDSATCTIVAHTYEDPALPDGCAGTVGSVLTVTAADGASLPCVEAGAATAPPADAPVLEYGGGSTVGEMTCLSSRNGVFCRHNPSGAGFSLARAGYQLF